MMRLGSILIAHLLLGLLVEISFCTEINKYSFGIKNDVVNKNSTDLNALQEVETFTLDSSRNSKNKRVKSNYYKLFNNSSQEKNKNEKNKRELERNENNSVHGKMFEDGNETMAYKDLILLQTNSVNDNTAKVPKEKEIISFIMNYDPNIKKHSEQEHGKEEASETQSLEYKNTHTNDKRGYIREEQGIIGENQNDEGQKKHNEESNNSEEQRNEPNTGELKDTEKNEKLQKEPDKTLVIDDTNDLFNKDKFLIIDMSEKQFDQEPINVDEEEKPEDTIKLNKSIDNSATIRIHSHNEDTEKTHENPNEGRHPTIPMAHIRTNKNERYKKFIHTNNTNFINYSEDLLKDVQPPQTDFKSPDNYDISKAMKNDEIPEENLKIEQTNIDSVSDRSTEIPLHKRVDPEKEKILKEEPRFTESTDNQVCSIKQNEESQVDPMGKYLSLKFLGLGYDIIIGNPEGEPGLNVDPGFKGPILKLNIENIDKTFLTEEEKKSSITPWIIPEHSCNQSKNVEEINTLEKYKSELSSDVKISTPSNIPYSFSASMEFKNALKQLKLQNNIMFMMKIYCLRYYTGIPLSNTWKFTDHFMNSLNKLPPTFDGLKEGNGCPYENYKDHMDSPECEKNVNKWIYFFKIHGTHITHEIYLGGKIILKINVNKEDYNRIKEKNINIKSVFQSYFSQIGFSVSSQNEDAQVSKHYNMSKNVSILGGNPGLDVEDSAFFEKWVQSINKNSMPVQVKLLPFSYFMTDPNMIQAYKDALIFYGLSYGSRIIDQEKVGKVKSSIGNYLEECTQNLYAGTSPGLLTCPYGSSIFMGFSLNLDFYSKKKLGSDQGIAVCEPLKESCSGLANDNKYADTRIWALCSKNPLEFLVQVTEQGESQGLTATCPPGLVILFGFALMKGKGSSSANNVDIYPCRTGQSSCSAVQQNKHMKQSMIYIACVDNTTVGLKDLQTYSQIKNLGTVAEEPGDDGYASLTFICPYKTKLVFGFTIEFHTNFPVARRNFDHCLRVSNACSITGTFLNTRRSFFKGDKHSLATIAVCKNQQ